MRFDWSTLLIVLWISLGITVVIILYIRLLRRFQKGNPRKKDFCVLYGLEEDPAKGVIELFFSANEPRHYTMSILDPEMNPLQVVADQESYKGGNIIRFDTSKLPNGEYYYCLQTSNQKTMKKMSILN